VKFVAALACVLLTTTVVQSADRENKSPFPAVAGFLYDNFQFFSEYHFDTEVRNFYFYKSLYYKQHYFLETTLNLNFAILSFRDRMLLTWDFMFINEMGQSPGNIVFDPIDIGYGISPYIEFRLHEYNFQIGIMHHCYHQVDRQDLMTVYFNNPVIALGSKNMRLQAYCENLTKKQDPSFRDRCSWYIKAGYYMRGFFGLIDELKINGVNPYVVDFAGEYRYCFYKIGNWFFAGRGYTMAGYHTDVLNNYVGNGIGWKQDVSLEAHFRRGSRGGLLFIGTTFDDLPSYPSMGHDYSVPRFSYDRLLQLGLKFFI
jgi:hypothetical protein